MPAKRIVSLVPSITELLSYFHLNEETIGITKFCIRPVEWFCNKQRVGGTKDVHVDIVRSLYPDLIIANKEENVAEQVNGLKEICPVYVSDVIDLASAYSMITDIGKLTGRDDQAYSLINSIRQRFVALTLAKQIPNVCYLIWQKPYMTVGGDTFISQMLNTAGFNNCFQSLSRYPEVTLEEIIDAGCDYLFLSSEPFPFQQKHATEIFREMKQLADRKGKKLPAIKLVDGEMFSWYGSRLLEAPLYFEKLQKSLTTLENF